MSAKPIYIVTPLADAPHAVRIEAKTPPSAFCDESEPVILQSTAPDALPLMQAFLSGLSGNTTWLGRESRGTAYIQDGTQPDGTLVGLHHAMNSRRPGPKEWYSILMRDRNEILELSILSETLTHQVFDALVAGTLQLRSATPGHP